MTRPVLPARHPSGRLYRVGRRSDAWHWPDWSYAGPDGTFGNRWDDPRGIFRVLYASAEPVGAFVEVLARFRPDPAVIAAIAAIEGPEEAARPGRVPSAWLGPRCLGSARVSGSFADLGQAESLTTLRIEVASELVRHGLDELDAATLRRADLRPLTQHMSRWIFEQSEAGAPLFSGVVYESRFGSDFWNWAVFERAGFDPLEDPASAPIDPGEPALQEALRLLNLELG